MLQIYTQIPVKYFFIHPNACVGNDPHFSRPVFCIQSIYSMYMYEIPGLQMYIMHNTPNSSLKQSLCAQETVGSWIWPGGRIDTLVY